MQNIAIIFAGGTGKRMNTFDKPKQFLEYKEKPILVYTLEKFNNHKLVDGIILVCLKEWINYAKELIRKFELDKVVDVVPGGLTGQESIFNGVSRAHELFDENSILLIHDGVRPLIDEDTITRDIECTMQNGSAITCTRAVETVVIKGNNNEVKDIMNRDYCMYARAPQCFILKDMYEAHLKANKDNEKDFIDSAFLMRHYNYKLYTVEGKPENIKITTPSDFYTFCSLIDKME